MIQWILCSIDDLLFPILFSQLELSQSNMMGKKAFSWTAPGGFRAISVIQLDVQNTLGFQLEFN